MQTVMIVDDSLFFRKTLARAVDGVLEVVGFAQDGHEAFELYKKMRPNFVFLDVTMPNCDGKECLELILQFDPSATVVMVSGLDGEQTVNECLQMGAKAYLPKKDLSQPQQNKSIVVHLLNKIDVSGVANAA